MKGERVLVATIFIFIIVFTPFVEFIVNSFNLEEPWYFVVQRALTGILLYCASMYALSGIKADFKAKPKTTGTGKRQINTLGIVVGIIIILSMWFTDAAERIAMFLYTSDSTVTILLWDVNMFNIVVRLIISLFTFIGVYIIKKSSSRTTETQINSQSNDIYELIRGEI